MNIKSYQDDGEDHEDQTLDQMAMIDRKKDK